MQPTNIAYYITNHGYGHGVRSCDIIRALTERNPQATIHIITGLPADFLLNRLPGCNVEIHARSFDFGMEQLDSVRVDVPKTLEKISALYENESELLHSETAWLQQHHIDVAVSDIPAIPLQAAHEAGIRAVAVGNFSWAWIYEEFIDQDPAWRNIIDRMNAAYRLADYLIRIPFAEPMEVFSNQYPVGLLARPGAPDRDRLAVLSGADPTKKWILLSFTTLEWDDAALHRVTQLEDYAFFTVRPLEWDASNIFAIDREAFLVADLFATVDAVLTKPGFGALSECVANQRPMIYVEREQFREYPVLEAALKTYLTHVHIPSEKLYAGDLAAALNAVWTAPPPREQLAPGGDLAAADLILRAPS